MESGRRARLPEPLRSAAGRPNEQPSANMVGTYTEMSMLEGLCKTLVIDDKPGMKVLT